MVHPGIIAVSVFGVVVTGVVIYTILKEEIHDFLESFEKPSPVGSGYERLRDQQDQDHHQSGGFEQDDFEPHGQSSSKYHADYELRQRHTQPSNEDENEKDSECDLQAERFRKINETERAIAANEARQAEMERAMKEREEDLQRSFREQEERMEQELRESREQHARQLLLIKQEQQQQLDRRHLDQQDHEMYQNPFASSEPRILDYDHNVSENEQHHRQDRNEAPRTTAIASSASSTSEVDSHAANAILRHDLSNHDLQAIDPFDNPSSLLDNSSASSNRSSVHGDDTDAFADAEDRSTTVGRDDDEFDWTEAEIGSMGSLESDESWASP
ncbi:hypothetical protein BG011_004304 [Mortierella polycephala]|uniref:Uncharacterized protein n=1 Tax=Mortierella polycephala TaxID=41804 RepID=A0A9P6PYL6_9FUNG|nr:hypothetical protein BG011_004304 [Mortierella polycephala]